MKYVTSRLLSFATALCGTIWLALHSTVIFAQGAASAPPAASASATAMVAASDAMPLTLKIVLGAVALMASLMPMLILKKVFEKSDWALKDALAEEARLTAWTIDPVTKVRTPLMSTPVAGGISTPVMVTEMHPSTSRLIAFIGMIAIVLLFVGFGLVLMYRFAIKGEFVPQIAQDIVLYLLGGASLFVPYVFNKFSGAMAGKA